jgi:acylphosphatase
MTEPPVATMVNVTGHVQGVAYRAWAKRWADARGLVGWVRNEADGSVSALIEGPEAQVRDMVAAMESGPPAAKVAQLSALPGAVTEAKTFEILH